MKYLKKFEGVADLPDGYRYQTDEEIEDGYRDWKISDEFEWSESKQSGWIILERPYIEGCDDCETEKMDNFIIYDDGRVAFDNWYPEFLYTKMVNYIYTKMDDDHPLKEKVEKSYSL